MQWPPKGFFDAKPEGWANAWPVDPDEWRTDEALKRKFGKLLAKHKPFDAACEVFENTNRALWVSVNWINDPIVQELRETAVEEDKKILDKDALCHKLVNMADEKSPQGLYYAEYKDRLATFKLYAEIQGYIGKVDTQINNNNFTNNTLKIKFVKPEIKEELKIIDNDPGEVLCDDKASSLVKLKLVSTGA